MVYLISEISKNSTLLFLYIIKVIIIKTIKKIKLDDDEIAISTSVSLFKKNEKRSIYLGKTYRVKYIESTNIDNLLYADGITLIVNQQTTDGSYR